MNEKEKLNLDKKEYHTPKLEKYGEVRELTTGSLAYSLEEGYYQEFTTG